MNTSTQSSTRAAALLASALFCVTTGYMQVDEPIPTTVERLDETAAREGEARASGQISARFEQFAGSPENATALVTGLRNGTAITLSATVDGQATTTDIQPATGKLGYGNAFVSLALAQQELAKAGITEPTAAQIAAALNGGSITNAAGETVELSGVLALRAAGQGWGDIAHTLGLKLGRVVSQLHSINQRVNSPTRPSFAGKPEPVTRGAGSAGRPEGAGRPAWAGTPHGGRPPATPPGHMVRPGRP